MTVGVEVPAPGAMVNPPPSDPYVVGAAGICGAFMPETGGVEAPFRLESVSAAAVEEIGLAPAPPGMLVDPTEPVPTGDCVLETPPLRAG